MTDGYIELGDFSSVGPWFDAAANTLGATDEERNVCEGLMGSLMCVC